MYLHFLTPWGSIILIESNLQYLQIHHKPFVYSTLQGLYKYKISYYCENYKLIISKENYKTILDIIYYDITNIYKQKILFNLVNYNINNIYKFKYYLNEKIYIYL